MQKHPDIIKLVSSRTPDPTPSPYGEWSKMLERYQVGDTLPYMRTKMTVIYIRPFSPAVRRGSNVRKAQKPIMVAEYLDNVGTVRRHLFGPEYLAYFTHLLKRRQG